MEKHLSMHMSPTDLFEVRYKAQSRPDWEVQICLGTSYASLYMSVEDARQFARDILAALPAPAELAEANV